MHFGGNAVCREAVKKEASAENLATLSLIILAMPRGESLSRVESVEALELASKAVELQPDDCLPMFILCRAAICS